MLNISVSAERVRYEDITAPATVQVEVDGRTAVIFTPATLNRMLRGSCIAHLCKPMRCLPDGVPPEFVITIVGHLMTGTGLRDLTPQQLADTGFTIARTVQDVRLTKPT